MTAHILDLIGRASQHAAQLRIESLGGALDTTFADLWDRSGAIAARLSQLETRRVAGILTPSRDVIASLVGCLRAGKDFVSLPLPHSGQSSHAYGASLGSILELAAADWIVVESACEHLLRDLPSPLARGILRAEDLTACPRTSQRLREPAPGELIQFSSGTTGAPNGVRLSGEAIAANVSATLDRLELRPGDSGCYWVPLSHDMGLIGGLLSTWAASHPDQMGCDGLKYTCMSPERFMYRPLRWLSTCARTGATITAAPTSAYHLAARQLERAPQMDLRALRICIVGAEPVIEDTLREFAQAAAPHGFREEALCPAYGLAEATLAVSIVPPSAPWKSVAVTVGKRELRYVSCGAPLSCVEVDAPEGREPGAIRIRGPAVSHGYLPARAASETGWLETRDMGISYGGELLITGRSDDLLCAAGRNIHSWEIEHQINQVRGVRSGGSVAVDDGRGGYVVLFERGAAMEPDSTLRMVRAASARAAGVAASAVGCVPRGHLPRTPSGKLRRAQVRDSLEEYVDACVVYRTF